MTRQEFKALRGKYKLVCRDTYASYQELARQGLTLTEQAQECYKVYWAAISRFARLVGCSVSTAADMLNIKTEV